MECNGHLLQRDLEENGVFVLKMSYTDLHSLQLVSQNFLILKTYRITGNFGEHYLSKGEHVTHIEY